MQRLGEALRGTDTDHVRAVVRELRTQLSEKSCLYPSATAGSEAIRSTRFDYYDRGRPPASTLLLFAGAGDEFAVDVVAPSS